MRRFVRKKRDTGENHERWLLTYADMITLLLGLFIIMYSISKVDSGKLKNVAKIIRSGFGIHEGASLVFDGGTGILEDDYTPRSPLYRLWERIGYSLKKLKDASKPTLGLATTEEIRLVLFTSELSSKTINLDKDTEFALSRIAELSKAMDVDLILRVQIPYASESEKRAFASKWDFNAHKAAALAKYISGKYGINEENLVIEGLSGFRLLQEQDKTPEGKARQERIEIIIRKKQ